MVRAASYRHRHRYPHRAGFFDGHVFQQTLIKRMRPRPKSEQLFAAALRPIPGGVNPPVGAFRAVGGQPFFVHKAKGARIWDVDGNEYIDYVGTWGPAILGHAHPKIIEAVQAAAESG